MFLRQAQHLVIVTLKKNFDFDVRTCAPLLLVLPVLAGIAKSYCSEIATELHNGLTTVKDDAIAIKEPIKELKTHWEDSDTYEIFTNNIRSLKDHFSHGR